MAIKFYIVNLSDFENFRQKTAEALGHNNITAEPKNLALDKCVMKFEENNLPQGFTGQGYTRQEISEELDSLEWTLTPSENLEIII